MAEFDIVIHGGRLIDGTGNPWFYGDVGIKSGKIASIGKIKPEFGQRSISAKGRIVTPGYIDMHTHSDQPLIADGNAESKVRACSGVPKPVGEIRRFHPRYSTKIGQGCVRHGAQLFPRSERRGGREAFRARAQLDQGHVRRRRARVAGGRGT